MINATEKTICGHAPLRWNAGFEPGGGVSPIALVVVCMAMQVEPVDGLARSICRAWPGQRGSRRYLDANRFYACGTQAKASRRSHWIRRASLYNHSLCIDIDVAHRKKTRPHRCAAGSKNTVSWHEDGARQVYDATHDCEILLVNKWCDFVIDSQREIFAQHGATAISRQFAVNAIQPARCRVLLSGSGNTRA
ncbi:hypothetical protein [Burkholderia sp. lyk4-R2A-23]|uniref:hypothetical protein n=1 Tax=Burkholderia sp. lyk4-R2A-23 TaxID=3040284 RepID=UPI00254E0DAD|nr:hypothetical protein [Burkholderia sp. lyk4-R2A-23]